MLVIGAASAVVGIASYQRHLLDFAARHGGLLYHVSYARAVVGALPLILYRSQRRRHVGSPVATPGGAM